MANMAFAPMERELPIKGTDPNDEDLLDAAALCRMFEESEEATYTARQLAERDRDYYDNKQLTEEEKAVLRKRRQPEIVINRIRRKVEFLIGLEQQQKVLPKAEPRTPLHEEDADGASQAMRYVAQEQAYDRKRSASWRNILVEGAAGIAVRVEPGYDGELEVRLQRVAWDRMFGDPHSSETDYSDATYLGVVAWRDTVDVQAEYVRKGMGEAEVNEIVDMTMNSVTHSDTYDDKPKFDMWADRKRQRIRICQIWIKRDEEWYWAEFTKGGILIGGRSPHVDEQGRSECELIFQSAYVDRDNNRYGAVREMISPQDEINKRRSKALHLMNQVRITAEKGAFKNPDETRREAARADAYIEVAPGFFDKANIKTNEALAASQFSLLQESKNEIDLMGPNATMLGDKAQGGASASGKAIIASQQGGMVELGDLLANLRWLDYRVFRAIWHRIRQYWTGQKWIRVTDDDRNIKWVGMNVPREALEELRMRDPQMAERIAGVVSNVAELDCDITIDEAPDSVTPALEQWEGLVRLAEAGVPIPPDVLVEAAPNLKNKEKLLERMEQRQPDPAKQQLEMRNATAEVAGKEAKVAKTAAETEKIRQDANLKPFELAGEMMPKVMPEQPELPLPPQHGA